MVKSETSRLIRKPIFCLALLAMGLTAAAQEAPTPAATSGTPAPDQPIFLPLEFRTPSNTVSVGFRILGSAKVTFSNLGTLSTSAFPGANRTDVGNRLYHDGFVLLDARVSPSGAQPNDGFTNKWSYNSYKDQRSANTDPMGGDLISFNAFSTKASDATISASSGKSFAWDVEYARRLGGKKVVWGVVFGGGMSDITAKSAGDLPVTLLRLQDTYSLNGAFAPPAALKIPKTATSDEIPATPYTAPSQTTIPLYDENGNPIRDSSGGIAVTTIDTTTLLTVIPVRREEFSNQTTTLTGSWDVKGAFATVRCGPFVDFSFSERFSMHTAAGVTLTIVGARMRYKESADLGSEIAALTASDETENLSQTSVGFFASAELQFRLTPRTGFFAGVIHEEYSKKIEIRAGQRVATVSATAGTGFRLGITARF